MVAFLSAECGADHIHGELKSQHHEVDDRDPEQNFDAAQSFDLRLRNPTDTRSGARRTPPD